MNRFAALDDSDNDEPKVTQQPKGGKAKATTTPAPKTEAPKPKEAAQKKETKPKTTAAPTTAPASPAPAADFVDGFEGKSTRGGAHHGKEKDRENYRQKKTNGSDGTRNEYHASQSRQPGQTKDGRRQKNSKATKEFVQDIIEGTTAPETEGAVEAVEETTEPVVEEPAPEPKVVDTRLTLAEWRAKRDEARAASALLSAQSTVREVNATGLQGKEDDLPETLTLTPQTLAQRHASKTFKQGQRSVSKTIFEGCFSGDSAPEATTPTSPSPRGGFRGRDSNGRGNTTGGRRGGKIDMNDASLFPSL